MLGQKDFAHLKGSRRIRSNEGASKAHSFVTIQMDSQILLL
jgi:hypothetical protein